MAMQGRRYHTDLTARMKAEPYRFRFFQAVRLLMLTEKSAGRKAVLPRNLRFRTPATLAFPASEITRFDTAHGTFPPRTDGAETEEGPQEMEVAFMGLTGPSGVLPQHYTELLMDRKTIHRDVSAHAFFDIFNHRAIQLFYAAWQKYRFYVGYELGEREGFSRHLLDMLATSRPNLQGDTSVERDAGTPGKPPLPAQILAFFAGALGKRPLPASSLESVVRAYFGVGVKLEQFVGQWIDIPEEDSDPSGGGDFILGVNTNLGRRVWDQQTRMGLRIGPLNLAQFTDFQPEGPAAAILRQLVETCVGQALGCDVTLVLDKGVLAQAEASGSGMPLSLGLTTWIRTRPPERDLDDVRYKLL